MHKLAFMESQALLEIQIYFATFNKSIIIASVL